jgi:hypothetical protein
MERECSTCRKWLPLTATFFPADPSMSRGLRSQCRRCKNASNERWRAGKRAPADPAYKPVHTPISAVITNIAEAYALWRGPVTPGLVGWRIAA